VSRRLALLAPACAVAACLGALARLLDHGASLGLGPGAQGLVGRLYFALLVAAPLLLYPLAWAKGAALGGRVALSLAPAGLWWLTEVGMRLRGHTLPEALWLAASPLNLAHLYALGVAIAAADAACRLVGRLRGGPRAPRRRGQLALVVAGLVLGPLAVLGSVLPYLHGYRALFQSGLLPVPKSLPGPLPPGGAGAPPQEGRPNFVVILSDDHRADFAGHAGHPFVETPSLDRLAQEGVRFERSYVTTSLCSPSRATLLTGTTPHRHGVWNNFTPWSNDNRTFLEHLAAAGYDAAFVGKWHMPGGLPALRGVDHFVTFTNLGGQGAYEWCPLVVDGREEPSRTRYIATELTDRALEWLEGRLREGEGGTLRAPFVLVLSHKSVHSDFLPDEPDRGRYAGAPVALPAGAHPWSHLTQGQYVHLLARPLPEAIRRYAEAVRSMDREIGRVLDFLDARGLRDQTLVLYTSDNGYLWGERGLVDKRWPYEASIRVPLLVRYPASGHPAGVTSRALVANLDVAPTLLDLAGLAVPERMQGRSLRPLLADPAAALRSELLYSYSFEPPYPVPTSNALVTPRLKWIELEGRKGELYDLEADPGEERPLDPRSPEAASLATRLALALEAARKPAAAGPSGP
jgi:N-acetylglucosamine-6-sulfatase